MRAAFATFFVIAAIAGASDEARAGTLTMPDERLAYTQQAPSETIALAWHNEASDPSRLKEQPVGEVLATRLGLVQGKVELFRYQMGTRATLAGLADGGGIKFKLRW